jgi:hypothetical protein
MTKQQPKVNKKVLSSKSSSKSNIFNDYKYLIAGAAGVLVAILAFLIWRTSSSVIKNLKNAEPETLKNAFFGDSPHLFYCDKGSNTENVPTIFSELNLLKGNKLKFAAVNCSQLLPSGKDLWNRFKLKKEWRPTIFATSPWSKPLQANPTYSSKLKYIYNYI